MKSDEFLTEASLGELCEIKTNFPNADFWLITRHDYDKVGKPVKEFNPKRIGIKVKALDVLDPDYLYFIMTYIYNQGYWQTHNTGGVTDRVGISVNDVKNIQTAISETWSKKYKKSINCNSPKGFSQRAHCAGRAARGAGKKTKSKSINESVTFSPAKLEDYNGEKMWSSTMFGRKEMVPCRFCDGTGIEGYTKRKGKGKFYWANPKDIEERLIAWDGVLKKLKNNKEKLESHKMNIDITLNAWLDSFARSNKELNLPGSEKWAEYRIADYKAKKVLDPKQEETADKMVAKIKEMDAQIARVDQTMKARITRLMKKKELVQKLETVPCGYCHGKGKHEDWVSDAPELNVSNSNAYEVQRMLGKTDPDYAGAIKHEELPGVMRRLIKLKNDEDQRTGHTQSPEEKKGEMRRYTDDQGMSRIGRGPTMYDSGRTPEQVERYVDVLIKMVQFAQKNGAGISWG